jgi:rRNA maturation protein Rpf1
MFANRTKNADNVVLRADIPNSSRGTVSESYPHLIFEGFTTKLGQRCVQILKHLFPPREANAKVGNRVVTYVFSLPYPSYLLFSVTSFSCFAG